MSIFRKMMQALILIPLLAPVSLVTLLLPQIATLRYYRPPVTAYICERPWPFHQQWRALSAMPDSLKDSVVAAEDANFYIHHGLDFREMRASVKRNLAKKKYDRGFSTITMQLARNLYLNSSKNILRKGLEIAIALEIETVLPKDRILELYLNLIEWGDGYYGAEAGAQHYFKKSVTSLTPEEAAFMAAIIPSPRRWGHWPPGPYVRSRQSAIMARSKQLPDLPEPDSGNGGL